MKVRYSIIVAGIALCALAVPLRAHHSIAGFFNAKSKTVSLTGSITRIELRNPHSNFYLDVMDASTGQIQSWKIEYGGLWDVPSDKGLHSGIVVSTNGSYVMTDEKAAFGVLKVGERVTLKGLQAVDGTFWVAFTSLLDEQGKSIIG